MVLLAGTTGIFRRDRQQHMHGRAIAQCGAAIVHINTHEHQIRNRHPIGMFVYVTFTRTSMHACCRMRHSTPAKRTTAQIYTHSQSDRLMADSLRLSFSSFPYFLFCSFLFCLFFLLLVIENVLSNLNLFSCNESQERIDTNVDAQRTHAHTHTTHIRKYA